MSFRGPLPTLRLLTAALCVAVSASAWAAPHDWNTLSKAQRDVLQPLQPQWGSIDGPRRQKWLEVAARFPRMTAEEQALVRSRMSGWAGLPAKERNEARVRFQDSTRLPQDERKARWEAYQSLSAEQRQALVDQAQARRAGKPTAPVAVKPADRAEPPQPKSNVVTAALPPVGSGKTVAPGTLKAGPGASTRPISQRPAPPRHQQAGLPKIAATPEFVHSTTLLPQRGPQGAAVTPPPPHDEH
jgi:hypothetical protein